MPPETAPAAPPANQKRAMAERPVKVERARKEKRRAGPEVRGVVVSAERRHTSGSK
jgi:hypothetical protein